MPSAILKATVQSAFITFCSCLIARFLTPDDPPHYVSLLLYSAMATPPNYLWQQLLEQYFPGFKLKKVEVDDGGKGVEVEKVLNVKNTISKVVLDQTVAAVPNVMGYIGITRLLRGVPIELAWEAVKQVRHHIYSGDIVLMFEIQQTIPVMISGYKLWPAVNVIQHVFVPVEKRTLVGSLVGLGWGTFLALKAAR